MSKTLVVMVVVGAVLLVALPAQARPVKQLRADRAASCYKTYRAANEPDITDSEWQPIFDGTPNKCLAILSRFTG